MTYFNPLCRARGHKGFVLQHYGYDRGGGFSKHVRLAHARAQCYYDLAALPDTDRACLRRKDWTLVTPCCVHVASKAIPWGMEPHLLSRKEDLKAIHIAVASLRNSSDLLAQYVPKMIADLEIVHCDRFRGDTAYQFWISVGQDPM